MLHKSLPLWCLAFFFFFTNLLMLCSKSFPDYKESIQPGQFSSVTQSCPTLCNPMDCSVRLPCPSPTSEVCSNSFPSSWWCHPTISSSVIFFSCLQSFPATGSSPVSQFFASGSQSIGVLASASGLPMNIQDWFPSWWTGWISLQSKGLSRVFSNTTVQKHQLFSAQLSLQSNSHIHTWLLEKPKLLLDELLRQSNVSTFQYAVQVGHSFSSKEQASLNFMVSSPITLWQIYGETMEAVKDFIFGLQNHCRWWLQPWN